VGEQIATFPIDPQLAKALVSSPHYQCSNEMLSLVALLSAPHIFMRPEEAGKAADAGKAQFTHGEGGHLTMLNACHAFKQSRDDKDWCYDNFIQFRAVQRADSVRQQLARIMQRSKLALASMSEYARSSRRASSCRSRSASASATSSRSRTTRSGDPSCALTYKPEWVTYFDFVADAKELPAHRHGHTARVAARHRAALL
jgi:pre-mRNA-splicing factor ATP-dependent RNA helicase DHX15/PRP43